VKVILGGNHFIDCLAILSYQGQAVLRIEREPLRIALSLPPDLPSASQQPALKQVSKEGYYALFAGEDQAIAIATLLAPDTVHLKLDLRPLGMNIYDDPAGLHIGNNLFSRNVIERAASAINLG